MDRKIKDLEREVQSLKKEMNIRYWLFIFYLVLELIESIIITFI